MAGRAEFTKLNLTDTPTPDGGGRYTTMVDGHELLVRYGRIDEKTIRVDYVGVPIEVGGRGLGHKLVKAVVDHARETGIKIVPVCSFAQAQFAKNRTWHDVLA